MTNNQLEINHKSPNYPEKYEKGARVLQIELRILEIFIYHLTLFCILIFNEFRWKYKNIIIG